MLFVDNWEFRELTKTSNKAAKKLLTSKIVLKEEEQRTQTEEHTEEHKNEPDTTVIITTNLIPTSPSVSMINDTIQSVHVCGPKVMA